MLAPEEVIDGKYRVVRQIGEGGMGAVYEAVDVRLHRRVAVKVMHAAVAKHKKLVARFEREAKAAAAVDSTHIASVFDLGDLPNGERYMVMEYLDGESLQARLKARGRLPPREVASIAIQLLDGLAKVHKAGIVHRDLKPPNIFLARTDDGGEVVKILDFGVCKMADRERAPGEISTGVGDLLGTLAYMSPEQLESGAAHLDARADLYAVGVMLYRAVTGSLPYGGATVVELMRELREGRAPKIHELAGDVDARFGAIVGKALEWDRTARFATARELQRALEDWSKSVERVNEVLAGFLDAPGEEAQPASPGAAARVGKMALRATIREETHSDGDAAPEPKRSRSGTIRMKDAPEPPGEDVPIDVDDD